MTSGSKKRLLKVGRQHLKKIINNPKAKINWDAVRKLEKLFKHG